MTVRLTINYEVSDGSVPSNIDVTWEDDARQPTPDDLIALIEGVARIADHRETALYWARSPVPLRTSDFSQVFTAHEDIEAGQMAGLRDGSAVDVVALFPEQGDQRWAGIAAEDLKAGDRLVHGLPTEGPGKVWRRAR